MIEPVRAGPDLIAQIAARTITPGRLAIWWLGQSGFLIQSPDGLLGVDLYLSEHLTAKYAVTDKPHVRMTRAPLRGHEIAGLDLLLGSHKHSDHIDPGTLPALLAANPGCQVVVPAPLHDHAASLGVPVPQIVGIAAGQVFEHAGFRIHALPSAHEDLDTDDQGRHLYLGFVIESEGLRLYHSGDTLSYHGLADWLGTEPFDVLMLPINGRDPTRGVPGNMNAAQAVDLASQVKPRFLVPHHYDMFTFNTASIESFRIEAARLPSGVSAHVLRCGERWEIGS